MIKVILCTLVKILENMQRVAFSMSDLIYYKLKQEIIGEKSESPI